MILSRSIRLCRRSLTGSRCGGCIAIRITSTCCWTGGGIVGGEKRIVGWPTYRPRPIAFAIRAYQDAIANGDVSWEDNTGRFWRM